jgi:hypothetical protein
VALVLVRGGDPALRRRALQAGPPRQLRVLQQDQLELEDQLELRVDAKAPSFLEDAANGALPSVSWIDPNFSNFNPIGFQPNDDHPPADIKDGQELVLAVYHALAASPQWEKTLLIIFYDEHGGFFDHVAPPAAPDDDPHTFGRYGVRIPALIVSPWVEPGSLSKTLFDHTIRRRFSGASAQKPRRAAWGRFARFQSAGHPATGSASRRRMISANFSHVRRHDARRLGADRDAAAAVNGRRGARR